MRPGGRRGRPCASSATEFVGATRGALGNGPVRACVGEAVREHLSAWLEQNPGQAVAVITEILRADALD
ncbi:hypothetical protein ABZY81_15010 [Streptomyces sp. NPDC006514]|uniref:hypothetical protein n=1 Tax=Streptomyces sp. NPDC006514 TaxID=3154308 RepID=UPI0033A38A97